MHEMQAHFRQAIVDNIDYWLAQTQQSDKAPAEHFQQNQATIETAVKFGLSNHDTHQKTAELIHHLSPLSIDNGQWQTWLPWIQQAVTVCPKNEYELRIGLLNRLGQLLRLQRQFDQAIAIHQEAEVIAKWLNDTQQTAVIWFHLSSDYQQAHCYDEAESYGLAALAALNAAPESQIWRACTLQTLGMVAREKGELETAVIRFQQAISIWQQLDKPIELGRALNNVALTLQAQKQFEAAMRSYQEAIAILSPTTAELEKSKVQNNLGILYFNQDQFKKAEIAFRMADSAALRQSGDSHTQAAIVQNIANTLLEQNSFEEAEYCLRHSLNLWEQANDNLGLANTIGTLAQVLANQGQPSKSIALYDEALVLLKAYPNNAWAKRIQAKFQTAKATNKKTPLLILK